MTTIKGDLLEIKEGVICHQVNCKGVAGAGLAKQIRDKWPGWYDDYRLVACQGWLGHALLFPISENLVVASLFAQKGFGRGERQTDCVAFESCLESLSLHLKCTKGLSSIAPVYFPAKIGAGLGGGSWDKILPLIEKHFPNAVIVEKL